MKKNFDSGLYNESMLLILGAPRSGTTLFAANLSSHSDVCILMEDYFGGAFRILSKKVCGVKLCTPNQIKYENNLLLHYLFKLQNLMVKASSKFLGLKFSMLNVTSDYSIKNYINLSKQISIIFIIRNPVEAIESEIKRNNTSREIASKQWIESSEIYEKLKKELGSERVLCVDYEDLVNSPKNTMEKALNFLDVEYQDNVLLGFKHTPQYQGRTGIVSGSNSKQIDDEQQRIYSKELKIYASITNRE